MSIDIRAFKLVKELSDRTNRRITNKSSVLLRPSIGMGTKAGKKAS